MTGYTMTAMQALRDVLCDGMESESARLQAAKTFVDHVQLERYYKDATTFSYVNTVREHLSDIASDTATTGVGRVQAARLLLTLDEGIPTDSE